MEHKHTLAVIVNNRPGVLNKVAGLFSRRGFNIESLAVGTTEDPDKSRMTIVAKGDDQVVEQITKQLYKLIDIIRVYDLPQEESIERELVLIRVHTTVGTRPEITQIVDLFRGKIVDVSEDSMTIEITGDENKVGGLIELLTKFGIKKLVRTGKISLGRGKIEKS
jgi:acetolactate synthase I/III small subunit